MNIYTRFKSFVIASFSVLFLTLSTNVLAGEDPIYTSFLSNEAVGGFDVVTYFESDGPQEGKDKYSYDYLGAEWLFVSQENLEKFKQNPEKYAPQYGGYCAYAAALGSTAKGEPDQWHIHENKLYLNYDANIKDRWVRDKENYIVQGDANWPKILD